MRTHALPYYEFSEGLFEIDEFESDLMGSKLNGEF